MIKFVGNYLNPKIVEKLSEKLAERLEGKNVRIEFFERVSSNRQHHMWFGGCVATVEYKRWLFSIEAVGDVQAHLGRMQGDEFCEIAYVKDRQNNGRFLDEMGAYIKNDDELRKLIDQVPVGELVLDVDSNNWWEIIPISPHGKEHDAMWVAEDYTLDSAIMEAIEGADDMIKYIESE